MTFDRLGSGSFNRYPPGAKAVAVEFVDDLARMPVSLVVSFLDQIISWDWKFPAERERLVAQLRALRLVPTEQLAELMRPFSAVTISPGLAKQDWLNAPAKFLQDFTAYLWSSHQIDGYRAAAKALLDKLSSLESAGASKVDRLVVVVGTEKLFLPLYPLFVKLRKEGLHATDVDPSGGNERIAQLMHVRSRTSNPYAHWVLDGSVTPELQREDQNFIKVSYGGLNPIRQAVLKVMETAVHAGWGPELLRSHLNALGPSQCAADQITDDPILQHFFASLFLQGSGTQIYSTSFVQWSAREILRRAQPSTLFVRVAARVRQRSLNEFLTPSHDDPLPTDDAGSLIDGDLLAFYTWLELQKLPNKRPPTFLVWFPGHKEAFLAGAGVPRGVSTTTKLTIGELLHTAELDL